MRRVVPALGALATLSLLLLAACAEGKGYGTTDATDALVPPAEAGEQAAGPPACEPWVWTSEEVPVPDYSGLSALLVDGAGGPHVIAHRWTTADRQRSQVVHVHRGAGAWTSEVVGDDIQYVSAAIDPGGALHVAYTPLSAPLLSGPRVLYATNASGAWVEQDVARGEAPYLVLDAAGWPAIVHVLHAPPVDEQVQVSRLGADGQWTKQTLGTFEHSYAIGGPFLAFTPDDQPVLAFRGGGHGLWLSRPVDEGWSAEGLLEPWPEGTYPGRLLAFAVDADGVQRLSFRSRPASTTPPPTRPTRRVTGRSRSSSRRTDSASSPSPSTPRGGRTSSSCSSAGPGRASPGSRCATGRHGAPRGRSRRWRPGWARPPT